MKFLRVICVLALVLMISAVAYAETQSVKVSGDIGMRAFARGDYDLDAHDAENNNGTESNDWETYLQSTVEIQIDADLTDNVSAVVRLVNQRVWGDDYYVGDANQMFPTPNGIPMARAIRGGGGVGAGSYQDSFGVDLSLAYIELKEFLYSPLTLRIGRQDLWFGRGMIIGNSLSNPSLNLNAPEYTAITSFDAVRATLDYDPWTIDGVYAKISENAARSDDDVNLMGVNVGYVFNEYNAEAEGYYWFKQARNPGATAGVSINSVNDHMSNDIHTLGLRGSFDPIEDWTVALEGAYQGGSYMGIAAQDAQRDRSAWMLNAMVESRILQDDYAWRPVAKLEYVFYSGEKNMGDIQTSSNGMYGGWNEIYRGRFFTAIREWQNVFYATSTTSSPASTNQHQVILSGTLEPTDSITLEGTYAAFWLAEPYQTSSDILGVDAYGRVNQRNVNTFVGQEVDLQVTWDYTEDVSFNLLSAWFFPGNHFSSFQADDTATDVVGSVKLSF